jgi:ankyrin repeat protein
MGEIYHRAERVIIWLGPATYETNVLMDSMKLLEKESIGYSRNRWGVSDLAWRKVWSDIQPKLRSMHSNLKDRQRIGLDSLFGRSWFRRVWIVQEVANARAAIVICGVKSVSARIFALAPSLMGFETDPHYQSILDIMPGRSREESWWSQSRDLRTLLLKFSSSDASDTRDNIYALLGLSSDAYDSALLRADYSKPVYSVIKDAILFLLHIPAQYHADLLCRWTMPLFLERLCFLSNAVLSWAICEDNEAITTLLLARDDIDLNFKDPHDGRTPLLMAVENVTQGDVARYKDNETIIKLLLARNDIDVNFKVHEDKPPLLAAVERNRKEVVKLLLARKDIDVNVKGSTGNAPLLMAVDKNYKEVVELLLAHNGVDVNATLSGETPLKIAVERNFKDIAKLLIARDDVDVNLKDWASRTLLNIAVEKHHTEIAKLLLARDDVDVNLKGSASRKLLHIAVENRHMEVVKLLLACNDVDINLKDQGSRTLLYIAVGNGYIKIAKLLLARNNVDTNLKDQDSQPLLYIAVKNGYTKIVKLLLARDNIDVNLKDQDGRTLLYIAVEKYYTEIAKLLLARDDVDVGSKDVYGHTALQIASERYDIEIERLLRARGATM